MADLYLAFDPSSSGSKAFYTLESFSLEWLFMPPVVIEVEHEVIKDYEHNRIGILDEERCAWIAIKSKCYAVGELAQDYFYGNDKILALKCETALYKVLAMVGAIASQKKLPSKFSLALGILLPKSEYADRASLAESLREALECFSFRGQSYQVDLVAFNCLPEGAGILMRGVEPHSLVERGKILILMMGYRNSSILITDKGALKRSFTTNYGFVRMLEMVAQGTSGIPMVEMVAPIYNAGMRVLSNELAPLLQSTQPSRRKLELASIRQTVLKARKQYWALISDWLIHSKLPPVEQVILAGGTSRYWKQKLETFFAPQPTSWALQLEQNAQAAIGEEGIREGLSWRMTDIYGYFFYVHSLLQKMESQIA